MKKIDIKPPCNYLCASHPAPCVLEHGHGDPCACRHGSHVAGNRRAVGVIEQTAEAAARYSWKAWADALRVFGSMLLFVSTAYAQELNLGVRDVSPRDSWTQGALLVGRPENFEIARTVLTATVPVGVQDFVVESTEGIPDGLLALIYDTDGRVVDGFDVTVTGPYTLHTNKPNRYQFEPGYVVQIAANVDPNGAILQGVGPGGTLRKVIVEGREVLREEIISDWRGRPRSVRWRRMK